MYKLFPFAMACLFLLTTCITYETEEIIEEVVIIRDYEPKITVSFSEDIDEIALSEALGDWEVALEYAFFDVLEPGQDADIILQIEDIIVCDGFNNNYIGCATGTVFYHNSCLVQIRRDYVSSIRVYIHEVGHCLGIGHDYQRLPQSIMTPVVIPDGEIKNHHVVLVDELLHLRAEENFLAN